ncbi:sensor histidine kinase [Paenibacillus methanolicus]|uniref:sensor histidine kinase n=1 Tax=Paenibacillus methanolicus TaxID=582686 RepID=UPI001FE24FD4|nr:sensor histidine kinase [Paenibacillus methanolicus]
MSVKTKLTCIISFIVFVLLILNVILNEYSTRVNLRAKAEAEIARIAEQITSSVDRYNNGIRLIDITMQEKLKATSTAVSALLDQSADRIRPEELRALTDRLELAEITILLPNGQGQYAIGPSSAANPSAFASPVWTANPSRIEVLAQSGSEPLIGSSAPPSYKDVHTGESWSYTYSSEHDFIISCKVVDPLGDRYARAMGPEAVISVMMADNPEILEISGFEAPRNDREGAGAIAPVFGEYTYADEEDSDRIAAAAKETPIYRDAELRGSRVIKGYFDTNAADGFVLGVVYDKAPMMEQVMEQRVTQIWIAVFLLLILVIGSYWIAGVLMRPINDVLWKINEVSFGRFDDAIQVNRKDEFGQLANRVNAMSKNLSVYTAKLKVSFEDNRSMKEYLESFINHTTDAIHVVDLEGRILQVNRAFERMFGYPADEAVGRTLPLVPEHLLGEEQEALNWLKSGRLLNTRETVRVTKSGEWIEVSITTSPIRDQHGDLSALASITRDVTSRNKMEELLRRSEKLTTVGQLAAGVAHEIRNPLTTLRGFLQLQQETGKHNSRHIDIMLSELDRINLIVGEFLILAKPQATRFETKDVRYVFGDVISLLDSQAHLCDIMFKIDFTTDTCIIACEENQLKQVFINVLKNAIEAMPEGGEITIRIARADARNVTVTIIDQGIGIPEEMIPKLGDPFFTGKETGTGLGLMVSQRIIQSHHGALDIASAVGIGTTVTITLPLGEQPNVPGEGEGSHNRVQ